MVRDAIELLQRLTSSDSPRIPTAQSCPVTRFAAHYLIRDLSCDMTCAELWQFYREVVGVGEAQPLTKHEFLRALPSAIKASFGIRKCHSIERNGSKLRGFKSVTLREDV